MGTGVDLVSERYLVCQVVRLPDGGQHCQVGGGHLGSNHDDDIILSGRNITSILLASCSSQPAPPPATPGSRPGGGQWS